MSDEQQIHDENLRLVLSTDQEQWLHGKIKESRIMIWAMLALLVVSLCWLAAVYTDTVSLNNEPACFMLSGEDAEVEKMRKEFLAEGQLPCPADGATGQTAGSDIDWNFIGNMTTGLSVLLAMASFFTLLRHIYLWRQFKGYLKDHRAFLQKYNRL